jgi:HPt (histidine-containing phosphotransfer) domain-containing protein
LILTQHGRQALASLADSFENAPDTLLEWNENVQSELERLRAAVDQLADSLGNAG